MCELFSAWNLSSLALGEQFPDLAAAWELQLPQILICSRHASHTILQSDGGALYLLQPPQQGQSMFYFYLPCLLCSLLNHWRVTQNLPLHEQSATWQKAQRIWAEECCHFLPFFFLEKEQILLLWSVVLNPGSSGLLIAASYCVKEVKCAADVFAHHGTQQLGRGELHLGTSSWTRKLCPLQ